MTRVLGLGEPLRGDDAVGIVVAEAVAARGVAAGIARDATALVDALLDAGHVVLVDAVLADAPVGSVVLLDEHQLDGGVHAVSTHTTSVAAAVALARALGATARLDVVGVVVAGDLTPRSGLSDPVRDAVPRAVDAVLELLPLPPEPPCTST